MLSVSILPEGTIEIRVIIELKSNGHIQRFVSTNHINAIDSNPYDNLLYEIAKQYSMLNTVVHNVIEVGTGLESIKVGNEWKVEQFEIDKKKYELIV